MVAGSIAIAALETIIQLGKCTVCGGEDFGGGPVIVEKLAAQWRLSPQEVAYVDRQQGWRCLSCGCNLRSLALARAVCRAAGWSEPLRSAVAEAPPQRILEINEAGNLTEFLSALPGHLFAAYPEVDMHRLPYEKGRFDLVVHSDTLEHVKEPVRALSECLRVLKPGGACCYTVPVIKGRLTASREGLPPSYHGDPNNDCEDFRVHTEYGADAWTQLIEAGFEHVVLDTFDYPSALAWTGVKAACD